ncbi:inositol hexakisphosphate-domain-containing protein [Lentinula aciculospora]|uniref:Inositol hexakisphosphate-domain-containing protein n=1 Tax=Lentinula aciculospora TaxID=153920 RepID=A0A9W9AA03_9AGAR|nr:inositol hexakisphosphate-domain-containing protein [Lentinula aciculospora]
MASQPSPLKAHLASSLKDSERSHSLPPSSAAVIASEQDLRRPASTASQNLRRNINAAPLTSISRSSTPGISLDLMSSLQRSEPSIVKTRTGSVLSRGFILKTDFYPSGRARELEMNLHGAPNFRAPRQGDLNVFGVAQPRTQGLRAILSVLRCRPNIHDPSHVVWFSTREEPIVYISGRPFVLRDSSQPRRTLPMSDRAENLEDIEHRLKDDILQEAARFGGLVLTHNEVAVADITGEGAILPTWTAVDINNVKTSRELWTSMKNSGWNVDYHRIPISPDRPIEDNYLDAYLRVIKTTDPLKTALVFSCGMGAVRTTFAMVATCLVRRRQLILRGLVDPYGLKLPGSHLSSPPRSGFSTPQPQSDRIAMVLEQATAQQDLSRSLLKLTYLLQQSLKDPTSQSAIELLIAEPTLLENLRKAHMGNYGIILSLLGCLDDGLQAKRLVDRVIDANDHVSHLREDILMHRIKYALTTMETEKGEAIIKRAGKAIEKYFFIIAFASFVESSSNDFSQSFSEWLMVRTEIWNQVRFLRKSTGSVLNVFAPVSDLSALSRSGLDGRVVVAGKRNDAAISGGQILGDEYSTHVIKNRSGIILRESTLLKSDLWIRESYAIEHDIRGAINFRRTPGTNIYALGQPTTEAIDEVVRQVKVDNPSAQRIVWITLREEPIVYVNGAPYCLRREGFSLRNMKDYGGISASRLEILEERLRDDVISELNTFGRKLLLHSETQDGTLVPVWEDVDSVNVVVLRDIMESRRDTFGVELVYDRIPITAERPPDFSDLNELIDVVLRCSNDTPIVVNCQLGRGRSTLASIILTLIRQWLDSNRPNTPTTPRINAMFTLSMTSTVTGPATEKQPLKLRTSYQIINNLLRVFRGGITIKETVDNAIDQCDIVYNLRNSIEESRMQAEQAADDKQKRAHAQKALQNLRRYFELIVFQAYLQSTPPNTMQDFESIETFVKNRPVIKTFERELLANGMNSLKPLQRADLVEGMAHPDEVKQVVMNRSGDILSASTILKSDFFSNLQKMTLPERIEGAPNFRRVPMTLRLKPASSPLSPMESRIEPIFESRMVCGSGMPTVEGLKRALYRVDAGPDGANKVFWTSLREEPVIYVAGRPHVLRLVDRPLQNVEATGVTTAVVEVMERNFKEDVICELRSGKGKILLHDEVEERPGVFSIIPIWESVREEDILTPRDVFDLIVKEGFKIDYDRVAITDEQAPLPGALTQLLDRVRTNMAEAGDFIFNCQMGRGRTTTGMVSACLISTTLQWDPESSSENDLMALARDEFEENQEDFFDSMDGPSEEEAYRQGEYKTILQLVGVLSHGKVAKRLTDCAIDLMQDVQNLRKAVFDFKVKAEACEPGTKKEKHMRNVAVNYLYRYGTLIVFANYLIEMRQRLGPETTFAKWLEEHREIRKILERRTLD